MITLLFPAQSQALSLWDPKWQHSLSGEMKLEQEPGEPQQADVRGVQLLPPHAALPRQEFGA